MIKLLFWTFAANALIKGARSCVRLGKGCVCVSERLWRYYRVAEDRVSMELKRELQRRGGPGGRP